jgi:hypothetical protein
VGGGSPSFAAEPAKPVGLRWRWDAATATVGLRNQVAMVVERVSATSLRLSTSYTYTTSDVGYLEEPGVISTASASFTGTNASTVFNGLATTSSWSVARGSYSFGFVGTGTSFAASSASGLSFNNQSSVLPNPVIGPTRVGTLASISGGAFTTSAATFATGTTLTLSGLTSFTVSGNNVIGTSATVVGGGVGSLLSSNLSTFGGNVDAATGTRVLGTLTLAGAKLVTKYIVMPSTTATYGVIVQGHSDITFGTTITGGTKTIAGISLIDDGQSRLWFNFNDMPTVTGTGGDIHFGRFGMPGDVEVYQNYTGLVVQRGAIQYPNGTTALVQQPNAATGSNIDGATLQATMAGLSSGASIAVGDLVRFEFTDGAAVRKAQADTVAHVNGGLAVAISTIAAGKAGFVVAHGGPMPLTQETGGCPGRAVVSGYQFAYVSATQAGSFTCTKPSIARAIGWTTAENWIVLYPDNLLLPLSQLYANGTVKPQEPGLNFPAGWTLTDNPAASRTDLTVPTWIVDPGSNGVLARTSAGVVSARTITAGGGGSISISSGDGVSGNPTISRAALTGDITASADSNATTIANDAVSDAKLRNSGALSLIGRSVNTSGDPGDISAVAGSGCVFREGSSTLACGSILESSVTNLVTDLAGKQATGNYITSLTGDVTAAGPGASAATIAADAVTYAKMQNVSAASRVLCRGSAAGAGDMQECTLGTGLSISGTTISASVGTVTGVTATLPLTSSGGSAPDIALNYDNVTVTLNVGNGIQRAALTGDVTASAGSNATTIAADAVTNTKLANMATQTFKGRTTAGTGDPEDLNVTQATAMLNVFTTSTKGLAPTSPGGTTSFLRADGTWAVPPGAGGGGTVTAVTASLPLTSSGGTTPNIALTYNGSLTLDGSNQLQRAALTGDVTAAAGSNATTIAPQAVVYSKIQNLATDRLLGRDSAGAGSVEEIALSTGLAFTGAGSITANLSTGVSGGQSVIGGTGAGDNLTISSTLNGTKGKAIFGSTTGLVYDEANAILTLGTTAPYSLANVETVKSTNGGAVAVFANTSTGTGAYSAVYAANTSDLTGSQFGFVQYSSGFTGGGGIAASDGELQLGGGSNRNLVVTNITNGPIVLDGFSTGVRVNRLTVSSTGTTVHSIATGIVKATSGLLSIASAGADYESPLTFSTGLTRSANTVTANLSTGVSGGQTLIGGTAAGNSITYSSTSNASKGSHIFGSTTGLVYNESTAVVTLGTASPYSLANLETAKSTNGGTAAVFSNTSTGTGAYSAVYAANTSDLSGTQFGFVQYGSGFTPGGGLAASDGELQLGGGSNRNLRITNITDGPIILDGFNGSARVARLTATSTGTTVHSLGTGIVKSTSGTLGNATTADVASALAVPSGFRVIAGNSGGTGLVASDEIRMDTASDWLMASNDGAIVWANNTGGSMVGATNYEQVRAFWAAGPVWTLLSEKGGTGTTVRDMRIAAGTAALRLTGANVYVENLTTNGYVKTSASQGHLDVVTGAPSAAYKYSVFASNSGSGFRESYRDILIPADTGMLIVAGDYTITTGPGGSVGANLAAKAGTSTTGGYHTAASAWSACDWTLEIPFFAASGSGSATFRVSLFKTSNPGNSATYAEIGSFVATTGATGASSAAGSGTCSVGVAAGDKFFVAFYRTDVNSSLVMTPVDLRYNVEFYK